MTNMIRKSIYVRVLHCYGAVYVYALTPTLMMMMMMTLVLVSALASLTVLYQYWGEAGEQREGRISVTGWSINRR